MPIDTEIYYANVMRIYFEITIKVVFGIKNIFPVLSSALFHYLWAELAPEQVLFIDGMACKKGWLRIIANYISEIFPCCIQSFRVRDVNLLIT